MKLPVIQSDKAWHYLIGNAISLAVLLVTGDVAASIMLTVMTAGAKELFDIYSNGNHTPELLDAAATIAGGAPVWLTHLLCK